MANLDTRRDVLPPPYSDVCISPVNDNAYENAASRTDVVQPRTTDLSYQDHLPPYVPSYMYTAAVDVASPDVHVGNCEYPPPPAYSVISPPIVTSERLFRVAGSNTISEQSIAQPDVNEQRPLDITGVLTEPTVTPVQQNSTPFYNRYNNPDTNQYPANTHNENIAAMAVPGLLQQATQPPLHQLSSMRQVNEERRLLLIQTASSKITYRTGRTKIGCVFTCNPSCYPEKVLFPTTEPLLMASKAGWMALMYTVFPLLSVYGREILVYVQLVIFTILLVFSIINITTYSERTVVDVVNVALSGTATFIAIFNVVVVTCIQRCVLARRVMCCRDDNGSDQRCFFRCHQFNKGMYMFFDLCPVLLSEIFMFPILICTMFQFILVLINTQNRLGAISVMFVLTGLFMFILVYVVRVLIVVFAFRAIQKARDDRRCCKSGSRLQIFFFIYMLAQMLLQVLMTVIVGNTFYYENVTKSSLFVSSYLIYMTVGSFIIPLLGLIGFIIPNYYSVRQYPIAFFLDVLRFVGRSNNTREMIAAEEVVMDDYKATKVNFCFKICHAISHFLLGVTSIALFAIFFAFIVCFLITSRNIPRPWFQYDVFGAVAALALNAGIVAVGLFWMIVTSVVLVFGVCIIFAAFVY